MHMMSKVKTYIYFKQYGCLLLYKTYGSFPLGFGNITLKLQCKTRETSDTRKDYVKCIYKANFYPF